MKLDCPFLRGNFCSFFNLPLDKSKLEKCKQYFAPDPWTSVFSICPERKSKKLNKYRQGIKIELELTKFLLDLRARYSLTRDELAKMLRSCIEDLEAQ